MLDTLVTKADVAATLARLETRLTITLCVTGSAFVVLLKALDFLIGP